MSSVWSAAGFNFAQDDIASEAAESIGRLFEDARMGSASEPAVREGTVKAIHTGGWLDLATSSQRGSRDDILVEVARAAGYWRLPLCIAALVTGFACADDGPSISGESATGADLDAGLGWRQRSGAIFGVPAFSGATTAIVLRGNLATPFALSHARALHVLDHSYSVVCFGSDARLDPPWEVSPDTSAWLKYMVPVLVAADAVGAAERSWELARGHVTTREQFGGVLADLQAVRLQLAEAGVLLVAARSLLSTMCSIPRDVTDMSLAARVDVILSHAETAAITATHLHGAIGYTAEHEVGWCRMRVAADRGLIRRSLRERSLASGSTTVPGSSTLG